ncbi:MAG: hypothetical protein Phyf2KO_11360 [Phycisphaerales bacterium]
MESDHWANAKEQFETLRKLAKPERHAAIQELRLVDPELARTVEQLLEHQSSSDDVMNTDEDQLLPAIAGYEIVEEVGRGGMGVVYKAWQTHPRRLVAIKLLSQHALLSERDVDRFRREANAASKIDHRNVVRVYAAGQEGNYHYIAMEYVDGRNLADVLSILRDATVDPKNDLTELPSYGSLGYIRALTQAVTQVAAALQATHGIGIVHRDIKPSNILFDSSGECKLADFGISRDDTQGRITISQETPGTPDYMSPEQVRAQHVSVDHRTDIYSLGAVLYELLTLRRPYEGATRHHLAGLIVGPAKPPAVRKVNSRVPRDLAIITERAMEKNRDERYSSASEFHDDLQRFLAYEAIVARPRPPHEKFIDWVRKHKVPLAVVVGIILVSIISAFVGAQRVEVAQITGLRAQAARWLSETPFPEWKADQRAQAWSFLREFNKRYPEIEAPEIASLNELLIEYRAQHRTELEDIVRQFRGGHLSSHEQADLLVSAMYIYDDLRTIFPGDDSVLTLNPIERAKSRVVVTSTDTNGEPLGATVFRRDADPVTCEFGPLVNLGRAPFDGPFTPGIYRIVIRYDVGGFREYPLTVGVTTRDVKIEAKRERSDDEIQADMVAFPGGSYSWSVHEGTATAWDQPPTIVAPFLIDRYEVSNAQYQLFLLEHPEFDVPAYWGDGYDESIALLPVAGISWSEAAAYAAWTGKRLPTLAEWLYAVSGPKGRDWPWTESGIPQELANVGHPPLDTTNVERQLQEYRLRARAVTSEPGGATSEGVLHLFGNVAEWTETVAVTRVDGEFVPDLTTRVVFGGAWDANPDNGLMGTTMLLGVGDRMRSPKIGFRCARSVYR